MRPAMSVRHTQAFVPPFAPAFGQGSSSANADAFMAVPNTARARTAAPASLQAAASAPAQTGWLRDLLTRASEPGDSQSANMPTHASRAGNRAFESISLEMARYVDANALMDAWDRYKYGERYVFTPALYGAQGQQIFEDVRQRYYGDIDFRQTADSYMAEFEALLVEASRDDRPGEDSTRSYLMSDTGKVYTLIAHAAGRLG